MRARISIQPVTLILSMFLGACASSFGASGSDPNALTADQFADLGPGITAYQAIERLRPVWLRNRGVNSTTFTGDVLPRLHVDSTPFDFSVLEILQASEIETARFINARDATTRYGTGYPNGLIDLRTKGAARPPG